MVGRQLQPYGGGVNWRLVPIKIQPCSTIWGLFCLKIVRAAARASIFKVAATAAMRSSVLLLFLGFRWPQDPLCFATLYFVNYVIIDLWRLLSPKARWVVFFISSKLFSCLVRPATKFLTPSIVFTWRGDGGRLRTSQASTNKKIRRKQLYSQLLSVIHRAK